MRSSPEPGHVQDAVVATPLELAELSDITTAASQNTVQEPEWRTFGPEPIRSAQPVASVAPAPLFEVSAHAGVPDRLLDRARARAQAAGYLDGWTRGVRAAEARAELMAERDRAEKAEAQARARADRERAITAVEAAATALERRTVPVAGELEHLVVSAALEIAESVIGHALRDDELRAPAALARTLALAPEGEDVAVRMHPEDITLLGPGRDGSDGRRRVTLVPDATLAPGDAVAVCNATEIDGRLAAAIERVKAVLTP